MAYVYQLKRIRCSFAYLHLHREHYSIQSKISTIELNGEVSLDRLCLSKCTLNNYLSGVCVNSIDSI